VSRVSNGAETLRIVGGRAAVEAPALNSADPVYAVINAASSSLDLRRVLDGIVEIATEATACHACFVYFVERDRLVLRAASPVYRQFVGKLDMGVDEGVAGWVARNRTPELIRDHLLDDPRVKYRPELEEERFQSMLAVPLPSRSGEVLGVIVLHTIAPREFDVSALDFIVHTASLLAGAIENAQVYEQARRRVDALTTLTELSQRIAAATAADEVQRAVTAGARGLLGTEAAHLYLL
jgi:signal transduction protein with GAF and PtsI domain